MDKNTGNDFSDYIKNTIQKNDVTNFADANHTSADHIIQIFDNMNFLHSANVKNLLIEGTGDLPVYLQIFDKALSKFSELPPTDKEEKEKYNKVIEEMVAGADVFVVPGQMEERKDRDAYAKALVAMLVDAKKLGISVKGMRVKIDAESNKKHGEFVANLEGKTVQILGFGHFKNKDDVDEEIAASGKSTATIFTSGDLNYPTTIKNRLVHFLSDSSFDTPDGVNILSPSISDNFSDKIKEEVKKELAKEIGGSWSDEASTYLQSAYYSVVTKSRPDLLR